MSATICHPLLLNLALSSKITHFVHFTNKGDLRLQREIYILKIREIYDFKNAYKDFERTWDNGYTYGINILRNIQVRKPTVT